MVIPHVYTQAKGQDLLCQRLINVSWCLTGSKGLSLEAWGWLHPAFLFKARNIFSEVLFPVLDFVHGCAQSYLTLCNPGL